jgi:ATP-dependent helicase/nuclease subunit B
MLDEATFGGADRIRPSKPKISIILGSNQGVFPKTVNKNGILIQSDKDKLEKFGIVLDDTIRSAVEENYLVYSMLCCPVDKAYILYSKSTMNAEGMEPSAFVTKVLDAFKDITVSDFSLASYGEFKPSTAKAAFLEIGSTDDKSFDEIKYSLNEYPQYKEKLDNMFKQGEKTDFTVSRDVSRKLFGNSLYISATKFDTFHKCSLSYLLKNGLRIKKLQKADLNVLQRGTIVHFVLEKMIEKHRKNEKTGDKRRKWVVQDKP